MATNTEWIIWQKQNLFRLLKLEHLNKGYEVKGLREQIAEARATMTKENIADVEKEITTLYG